MRFVEGHSGLDFFLRGGCSWIGSGLVGLDQARLNRLHIDMATWHRLSTDHE